MEITEVKVFPIQEEKLKAFVSIVFDQCFMVNDIKIIQGRDGLFISMPSRKKKNGEFKDVAHPLNNETRRMIEDKVLVEYERVLGERGEALPAPVHAASPGAPPPTTATLTSGPSTAAPHDRRADNTSAMTDTSSSTGAGGTTVGTVGTIGIAATAAASGASFEMDAGGGLAALPIAASAQTTAGIAVMAQGAAPPAGGEKPAAAPAIPAAEKTLDEIEEMHLRDSFWTVT